LISSFNGKPQASLYDFAYTCCSPLGKNAEYALIKSPPFLDATHQTNAAG
jgi:hypothetical protein